MQVALWPRLPQDVAHIDGTMKPEPPGLGVRFANVTPALRQKFGLRAGQSGAVIAVGGRAERCARPGPRAG